MKKIMFNDKFGLTKAVLEGRKTMTRRFISEDVWQRADVYRHKHYEDTLGLLSGKKALIEFSPFKVGEVVAVAQKYSEIEIPISRETRIYNEGLDLYQSKLEYEPGWTNKMFVKADLMPHQIRITNVRVERLQDISDEDCFKEGIQAHTGGFYIYWNPLTGSRLWLCGKTPRAAFADLIDKVCGKGTWDKNPWVFVYEFELVK